MTHKPPTGWRILVAVGNAMGDGAHGNGAPGSLEGQHASMVLLDVESFGDPGRTAADQLQVRAGMYGALGKAFGAVGIVLGDCDVEDRGDGVMVLVPAVVSKNRLVAGFPDALREAVAEHNAGHSANARFRLRVALHAGEVHRDAQGSTSDSLNFAFRLLDAAVAKQVLGSSAAELVVIASEWFYNNVIRHDPAAHAGSYAEVAFQTKETSAPAWIRLPGAHRAVTIAVEPVNTAVAVPLAREEDQLARVLLTAETQTRSQQAGLTTFVDALLAIPTVRQESGRRLLLDHLRPEMANAVPYFPQTRHHVFSLVRTCMNYPGGLDELLAAIRELEGASIPVRRLDETVTRLLAEQA
ncbi:hypothetical protein [Actinocrispum sp. NPDC049592]|uniref:effector-associated domain 2-containing protein n=1 Tax=Actinocrispum sp. NPDC049592 TaxID=3154835 RepID=UPI0034321F8B